MKLKNCLAIVAMMLTAVSLTSCDKVADVVLEAYGAYTFNENAVILQKEGDVVTNVNSRTITVNPGSTVYLFIGDKNTKKTLSYSKTTWSSDDTEVATVTGSKSNGTNVTIVGVGVAVITATDVEGNRLTTTIIVEDEYAPEDPEEEDPEYPEEPEDPEEEEPEYPEEPE
ncbi:MAG: hypothetical protein IJ527_02055 [Prevotella sp.]|nr:hypothetical protein [Prevotella sp.]